MNAPKHRSSVKVYVKHVFILHLAGSNNLRSPMDQNLQNLGPHVTLITLNSEGMHYSFVFKRLELQLKSM